MGGSLASVGSYFIEGSETRNKESPSKIAKAVPVGDNQGVRRMYDGFGGNRKGPVDEPGVIVVITVAGVGTITVAGVGTIIGGCGGIHYSDGLTMCMGTD